MYLPFFITLMPLKIFLFFLPVLVFCFTEFSSGYCKNSFCVLFLSHSRCADKVLALICFLYFNYHCKNFFMFSEIFSFWVCAVRFLRRCVRIAKIVMCSPVCAHRVRCILNLLFFWLCPVLCDSMVMVLIFFNVLIFRSFFY